MGESKRTERVGLRYLVAWLTAATWFACTAIAAHNTATLDRRAVRCL